MWTSFLSNRFVYRLLTASILRTSFLSVSSVCLIGLRTYLTCSIDTGDKLLYAIEKYPIVIVVGQTGCGKTTRSCSLHVCAFPFLLFPRHLRLPYDGGADSYITTRIATPRAPSIPPRSRLVRRRSRHLLYPTSPSRSYECRHPSSGRNGVRSWR